MNNTIKAADADWRSVAVQGHLYSRSLRPGGVLLKLAVVDGEVRPEVTAVTQRRDTAAERRQRGENKAILMFED